MPKPMKERVNLFIKASGFKFEEHIKIIRKGWWGDCCQPHTNDCEQYCEQFCKIEGCRWALPGDEALSYMRNHILEFPIETQEKIIRALISDNLCDTHIYIP